MRRTRHYITVLIVLSCPLAPKHIDPTPMHDKPRMTQQPALLNFPCTKHAGKNHAKKRINDIFARKPHVQDSARQGWIHTRELAVQSRRARPDQG